MPRPRPPAGPLQVRSAAAVGGGGGTAMPEEGGGGGGGSGGSGADAGSPKGADGSRLKKRLEKDSLMFICDIAEFRLQRRRAAGGQPAPGNGPIKRFRVIFLCNAVGTLIGMSRMRPAKRGIGALLDALPNLGKITESLENPNTPDDERIIVVVDKELERLGEVWPGADIWYTARSETREPVSNAHPRSKQFSPFRITVERSIADVMEYRMVGDTYVGSPKDLREAVNIVAGLVNLKIEAGDPRVVSN